MDDDPNSPVFDESKYEANDWSSCEYGYLDGKEEMSSNMQASRVYDLIISSKLVLIMPLIPLRGDQGLDSLE